MRVLARSTLAGFWSRHPEARVPLERWNTIVRSAEWTSMDDVRRTVPKAKVLNGERAGFEVAGGDFRLIAAFDFRRRVAFGKFVGTHAEYDRGGRADRVAILRSDPMDIRPIRNDADHRAAPVEIDRRWGAPVGSAEGDELEVLVALVGLYEERRWPILIDGSFDPVDVLQYAIDEFGHTQAELAELLGSRSRASEILSRRRALTVEMIHRIGEAWKIPADLLVRPYAIRRAA